ncbi:adenosine receptor A3 [Alligator mississippiensis]|uniref:Adenosine receptor A3 n=1 Tax=Alligator mississippiensis TaxID=8496 RepID=A0A151MTL8_ALLMI|nr:adenosine receptor A3 [Alligator mississippiensis]KYO27861.1 adenosine receptor A3 [Alligator mississippiensis]
MTNSSVSLSTQDAIYIAVESIIAVSATVGNALVIGVVKLNPSFQNTTFYFIISLALADIAVGLLVMPLAIVVSQGLVIPFYACLFVCCLLIFFTNASILSLLAIAIDRYLRVKLHTRYKIITTQRRIWVALGLCWLVSLLTAFVPMFGWNKKETVIGTSNSSCLQCKFTAVIRMDYMVYFGFFICILIPLIIMCVLYVEVFYIIYMKLSQSTASIKMAGGFYGKEFKTAKSLALVLFLFAVSWLPLCIFNCISYFCHDCDIPKPLLYLGILLSHANSAMNPIVYACRIKKFKETYILIFKTYILCTDSEQVISSIETPSDRVS